MEHTVGWFGALVFGILQGLTEFLPISSSAHLRIAGGLVPGWGDPGAAFTAVIQLGTESAVVVYFRREIWAIIRTWTLSLFRPQLRREPDARMGWYIIVGTLPIAILGFLFQNTIETALRSLVFAGVTLIVFGVVLGLADAIAANRKPLTRLRMPEALAFGCAQALALIPGVSRSGGTITAGLLMGYTREAAAKYSFLLAIPAVFASGLLEILDIGGDKAPAWGPTILATIVSFVVGYIVIVYFMRYISQHNFMPFVIYRAVLGSLVLLLLAFGVLHPYV
ncbi:undecaprenyl-diphosphate phosphatase [Actinopolymorpha singaporensis]|uniref:Undecaprenyl-diphosphatase n=1 Tax=Actinopolymorpha singaporensis TaxID=117157 RepID=A0A1H1WRE2_9ACTN|nr:undecaprenyl-diphosphate phosphatase [Actinopolymorpha singaporensis]SDS99602.1 undecaprenyl-diphosphatase [Actinopolymorpha singaporensis]